MKTTNFFFFFAFASITRYKILVFDSLSHDQSTVANSAQRTKINKLEIG